MGRHGGYGGTRGGDGGEGGKISFAVAALIAFVVLALAGKIDAEGALAKFLSVIKIVGIIGIVSVLVLILTAIGFAWWAAKKEAKRKEDERAQQLLNTPLESFGDLETQQLMDKYDGKTSDAGDSDRKESGFVNPYSAKANQYKEGEKLQSGR